MASEEAIAAALATASPTHAAIIRLGAECGLRLAEIASLRVENRDGNWIRVIGKGSVERNLYLSPELAEILDDLERTTVRWGYYFPGRAKSHLADSTVWKIVNELVGVNTHALRHRAGTTAYRNAGFDIRLAQEFLGHSSPTTTAGYVHVERERLIDASAATRLGPVR